MIHKRKIVLKSLAAPWFSSGCRHLYGACPPSASCLVCFFLLSFEISCSLLFHCLTSASERFPLQQEKRHRVTQYFGAPTLSNCSGSKTCILRERKSNEESANPVCRIKKTSTWLDRFGILLIPYGICIYIYIIHVYPYIIYSIIHHPFLFHLPSGNQT